MTVSELIKQLQLLGQDRLVLVTGYEDGFCDITKIIQINVKRFGDCDNDSWWSGEYQKDNDGKPAWILAGKSNSTDIEMELA